MKIIFQPKIFAFLLVCLFILSACTNKNNKLSLNEYSKKEANKALTIKEPSPKFKTYWYAGKAEITSFSLEQARYGEIRHGKATLIYVTEDFLPNKQLKADTPNANNISVLKLNSTKKFHTGLYPYSIMESTFFPVSNNRHALKVSSSIQEWCGHTYAQLNNKNQFIMTSHSYFQNEGDQYKKLEKNILENELWTQLRINPKSLPIGDLQIIPSLAYSQLKHIKLKAYKAIANLTTNTYSIFYPDLNRTLIIKFNSNFPYQITGWEETFKSGYGKNARTLTTKAIKLKSIKSAYWTKNKNKDIGLRDTLLLN